MSPARFLCNLDQESALQVTLASLQKANRLMNGAFDRESRCPELRLHRPYLYVHSRIFAKNHFQVAEKDDARSAPRSRYWCNSLPLRDSRSATQLGSAGATEVQTYLRTEAMDWKDSRYRCIIPQQQYTCKVAKVRRFTADEKDQSDSPTEKRRCCEKSAKTFAARSQRPLIGRNSQRILKLPFYSFLSMHQ